MKIKLRAAANFELPLTLAHVDVLFKYAFLHYDGLCKSLTYELKRGDGYGGMLTGWRNSVKNFPDSLLIANSHQIDILRKVLEYGNTSDTKAEAALRAEMQAVFRACMQEWDKKYFEWESEFEG